jgi:hypothetical protein
LLYNSSASAAGLCCVAHMSHALQHTVHSSSGSS